MSFSNTSNKSDTRLPDRVTPQTVLNGLCERIVIETLHIYDESVIQEHRSFGKVTIDHIDPPNPTLPLVFEKAKTASSTGILQNLQVTRLPKNEAFSRIKADCLIAFELIFKDANENKGKGFFTVAVPIDTILQVPESGHVHVTFSAQVDAICPQGKWILDNTFSVDSCINIVIKCGAVEDLVIPCYGNALVPRAIEFSERVCNGFFEKPLNPHPHY